MILREYHDRIEYTERLVEISWRRGSLEVNEHWASVRGVRLFRDGCWSIVSVQGSDTSYDVLEKRAYKILYRARRCDGNGLLDDERCSGKHHIGEQADIDELVDTVLRVADKLGSGEIVLLYEDTTKTIDDGSTRCIERKHVYELTVFQELRVQGKVGVGSSSIAFTGKISDLVDNYLDSMVEEARIRAKASLNARRLNPLDAGKTTLVLGHEVSTVFFHELAHMLEADVPQHLGLGQRISTISITIRDDPFYPWSPSIMFFDDEGVVARRKSLVEDGEVVGLLHTRSSAAKMLVEGYKDIRAGQSRGLFHIPKATHSTLIVESGDWGEKEIVEETRRGILVDGVIRAEVFEGMVTIVPESAWRIERGEAVEPVFVRQIKLPLFRALTTIDALSRSLRLRASIEKGHRVAEVAPMIRLVGYVEV